MKLAVFKGSNTVFRKEKNILTLLMMPEATGKAQFNFNEIVPFYDDKDNVDALNFFSSGSNLLLCLFFTKFLYDCAPADDLEPSKRFKVTRLASQ